MKGENAHQKRRKNTQGIFYTGKCFQMDFGNVTCWFYHRQCGQCEVRKTNEEQYTQGYENLNRQVLTKYLSTKCSTFMLQEVQKMVLLEVHVWYDEQQRHIRLLLWQEVTLPRKRGVITQYARKKLVRAYLLLLVQSCFVAATGC